MKTRLVFHCNMLHLNSLAARECDSEIHVCVVSKLNSCEERSSLSK